MAIKINTKTLRVSSIVSTYDIPVGITNIIIRNNSINNVDIQFDDDTRKDKFTLVPFRELPPLELRGGVNSLKYKARCGSGELQLLMWG